MDNRKHNYIEKYVGKFNELKIVFDNLPDGIVAILDTDMNIATANKAISEMLNLPISQIIGRNTTEIFNKQIPGLSEIIQKTISTKNSIRNYNIELLSQSGDTNSFLVSTSIIEDEYGGNYGIVLILHDISEITRLRKIVLQMQRYGEIIGKSKKMRELYSLIDSIKNYDTSILISGETGTGKELIARTIHRVSKRNNKPFIPVNCAALPENLIESELFGHVKGAFTDAISDNMGRFEAADGGTLFLDEIATLSKNTQVKLLRVLQERVIERVGSSKMIPVDVRIISATNVDLTELIKENKFREDLYYRIKVFGLEIPPLYERKEDIKLLAEYFITKLNRYYDRNIIGISNEALQYINNYVWPGNVRELENAIEHAFILATGVIIEGKYLPAEIRMADNNGLPPIPKIGAELSSEEEDIKRALLATKGNITKTSEILNMHRSTLWRKMRIYNINKNIWKEVID